MSYADITLEEFLYCAVLAFFITWFIKNIIKIKNVLTGTTEYDAKLLQLEQIMEKCCSLFPKDIVKFKGMVYKRGMIVRVTTLQNKTFVGKFIGMNSKNMVCIITIKHVVAHEIYNIDNMEVIDIDTI